MIIVLRSTIFSPRLTFDMYFAKCWHVYWMCGSFTVSTNEQSLYRYKSKELIYPSTYWMFHRMKKTNCQPCMGSGPYLPLVKIVFLKQWNTHGVKHRAPKVGLEPTTSDFWLWWYILSVMWMLIAFMDMYNSTQTKAKSFKIFPKWSLDTMTVISQEHIQMNFVKFDIF